MILIIYNIWKLIMNVFFVIPLQIGKTAIIGIKLESFQNTAQGTPKYGHFSCWHFVLHQKPQNISCREYFKSTSYRKMHPSLSFPFVCDHLVCFRFHWHINFKYIHVLFLLVFLIARVKASVILWNDKCFSCK